MFKIIAISFISLIISSFVKTKNQDISIIISIASGVFILMLCYEKLEELINFSIEIGSSISIDSYLIKLALKIMGIGYVSEFTADIADDFGNKIISSKVVLAGKIAICYLTLPIIKQLLFLLLSFA